MNDNVILLGIAFSLIFSDITGIIPCGIIVPGYIALNLNNPQKLIYTFIIIIITLIIVKLLSKICIIYGRRRFTLMILTAFIINFFVIKLNIFPNNPGLIGTIIPGIIANQLERQGFIISILSLVFVVITISLFIMLFSIPLF